MNLFAISDLHLPGGEEKPMHIFGAHWENHFEQIKMDWKARVLADDIVLIPGDISWAMHLAGALSDLAAIGALPGRKVLLRGNHDYWWNAIARVRDALPSGMYAIQNDAVQLDGVVICGSRGWQCPASSQAKEGDERIYQRELLRLKLSLDKAHAISEGGKEPWRIAMLHFPPFGERFSETEVTRLLSDYAVHDAVYGHLHGAGLTGAFSGELEGVRYHQVSCDGLGFRLHKLEQ